MHPKQRCPICKRALQGDPVTAPFCGPRCKAADLGNWLDGRYAIDAGPAPSQDIEQLAGLEGRSHE